jgi:hypothetical protein
MSLPHLSEWESESLAAERCGFEVRSVELVLSAVGAVVEETAGVPVGVAGVAPQALQLARKGPRATLGEDAG